MCIDCPIQPGPALVSKARYISRESHELEQQYLWSRVWQQSAHEDDFAKFGDVGSYDIVDKSCLRVRTGEDDYKAFHNACLHRGCKLQGRPRVRAIREPRIHNRPSASTKRRPNALRRE